MAFLCLCPNVLFWGGQESYWCRVCPHLNPVDSVSWSTGNSSTNTWLWKDRGGHNSLLSLVGKLKWEREVKRKTHVTVVYDLGVFLGGKGPHNSNSATTNTEPEISRMPQPPLAGLRRELPTTLSLYPDDVMICWMSCPSKGSRTTVALGCLLWWCQTPKKP